MNTILDYIEESASKYESNIAVSNEVYEITYNELIISAKKIGTCIVRHLLSINQPIAIYLEKSPLLVETMMGIMYSNNFYAVLDVFTPIERISRVFETLQPAMIITNAERFGEIAECFPNTEILLVEQCMAETLDEERLKIIRDEMVSTDAAYVLYTSGSTGVPKGTVISHGALMAYIDWFSKTFSIDKDTIFGSQTPLYFSMSVSDLYGSLCNGGRYQIIPKKYFSFPMDLIEYLNRFKVNTIYWVPSALNIVSNWDTFHYCKLEYLKTVLFAGEVMPVKQLNYWRKYCTQASFTNLFGPTETTDICTFYQVTREFKETESLPIGIACDNCKLYIFDGEMRPSTRGELYVGGPFLAEGYYNNPEKTKEVFVQNPLNHAYPEIVYRTGDLVERGEDGNLIYLGRRDFQIKHMGYRIELGEIEARLGAIKGVLGAACVYDKEKDQIIAYYMGDTPAEIVREVLIDDLPSYMLPEKIVCLKQMPYNENGKIDRKKLMNGDY